jgi:choline dehydrogenase-like flavoprotein
MRAAKSAAIMSIFIRAAAATTFRPVGTCRMGAEMIVG